MASNSAFIGTGTKFFQWFPGFVRDELAPYPGRASAVVRITVAVVISFVLVSTFQIPGGSNAVYNVFLVTRDTPAAAVRSALISIGALTVGIAFSLMGIAVFADLPLLHFLFTSAMFLALFWLIRVLLLPGAAITLGMAIYTVSNTWTLPYPPEQHVEETLWFWASMTLGLVVAACVEVVLGRKNPTDVFVEGIDERLKAAESLIDVYARADGDRSQSAAAQTVTKLATVGTGQLRRQLQAAESGLEQLPQYLAELNAVVALSGRLIDLLANTTVVSPRPNTVDQQRLQILKQRLSVLRSSILKRERPEPINLEALKPSTDLPLLPEIEKLVSQIPQAFSPAQIRNAAAASVIDDKPETRIFAADALSNPEYLRFALKGWLAATICYILYTGFDWPGISTAVVTCMVTALSTVGASHQKQILRTAGAALGGVLAITSLVFILPNVDRITAVALLVAAVSAGSAWVATSSPQLSYFGLQTALAFYITTLQDYSAPTALSPARDRFLGILLGLTVMWVVGDQLWPTRAAEEMRKALRENITRLGQLLTVLDDIEGERISALPKVRQLRELINSGFQTVQEQAGTILFEFGSSQAQHLELRDRTLGMQASLRTIFLLELAIIQYRVQLHTNAIPNDVRRAQIDFNQVIAQRLNKLAESAPEIEVEPDDADLSVAQQDIQRAFTHWYQAEEDQNLSIRTEGILSLSGQIVSTLKGLYETADASYPAIRSKVTT